MKRLAPLSTLLLVLGCGSDADLELDSSHQDLELGSAEQELSAGPSYGVTAGGGLRRCTYANSGIVCYFPNNRQILMDSISWGLFEVELDERFAQLGAADINGAESSANSVVADADSAFTYTLTSFSPEVQVVVNNNMLGTANTTQDLPLAKDEFDSVLRLTCTSEVNFIENPNLAAVTRRCDFWKIEVDVDTFAAWVFAQVPNALVHQTTYIKRLMIAMQLLVRGIGFNTSGTRTDYMSSTLPRGFPDNPVPPYIKINDFDRCLMDKFSPAAPSNALNTTTQC